jgi:hypothetical protein
MEEDQVIQLLPMDMELDENTQLAIYTGLVVCIVGVLLHFMYYDSYTKPIFRKMLYKPELENAPTLFQSMVSTLRRKFGEALLYFHMKDGAVVYNYSMEKGVLEPFFGEFPKF